MIIVTMMPIVTICKLLNFLNKFLSKVDGGRLQAVQGRSTSQPRSPLGAWTGHLTSCFYGFQKLPKPLYESANKIFWGQIMFTLFIYHISINIGNIRNCRQLPLLMLSGQVSPQVLWPLKSPLTNVTNNRQLVIRCVSIDNVLLEVFSSEKWFLTEVTFVNF